MSHDLCHLIDAELHQLGMLIETRRPLINRSLGGTVSVDELDALSALLHSAYTAMERIMVHISKREGDYEELRPKAFMWHSALLHAMSSPTANRPQVISKELQTNLQDYLGFRHVFRHAYLHELQWSKMRPLVENLRVTVLLFSGGNQGLSPQYAI